MDRRAFLKSSVAVPTAVSISSLPRVSAAAESAPWRVFEVTTVAEILWPAGVSRVWLPVPLTVDAPYQKGLGNRWQAEGGKVGYSEDAKYSMGIVHAEFPGSVKNPKLVLVSRFATRDRAVDRPRADAHAARLRLRPGEPPSRRLSPSLGGRPRPVAC